MFFSLPIPHQVKVNVTNRVMAKAIDMAIVFTLALVFYPAGPLLGFFYSVLADGLHYKTLRGQSIGKKIMGLRVVSLIRGKPANFRESMLRNSPVGIATFFAIIPFWGWLILALIGIPLMLMEIYLMLSVDTGRRLGDIMGDTEVIDVAE